MTDKDKAILFARKLLETEFVVLDTETTGVHPERGDEALTVGIIDKNGETLLDARVKPTKTIHPNAEATHGVGYAQATKFPPFAETHPHLARILKDRTVVSYCVGGFDEKIIHRTCVNNRLPLIEFADFREVLYPASTIVGEWNDYFGNYRWQKLETAARFFNVEVNNAHNAIGDCLMTLAVIEAMAQMELTTEQQPCERCQKMPAVSVWNDKIRVCNPCYNILFREAKEQSNA